MPVTKITLSTAMRARDVSRPLDDHLAEAAKREGAATRQPEPTSPKPAPPPTQPSAPEPAQARRRRRRRS
jgi:hypothetical protein